MQQRNQRSIFPGPDSFPGRRSIACRILPVLACALVMAAVRPPVASAVTRQVPAQYPTVGQALAAASGGDVIVIAPGVHQVAALRVNLAVTLRGSGAEPADTILDAGGLGRLLQIEAGSDTTFVMNLTLRGGRALGETNQDRSGGAVFISQSLVRFVDCNFIDNLAESNGGAIRAVSSELWLAGCRFAGNQAPGGGGGALEASFGTRVLITDCTFQQNSARWGGAVSFRMDGRGVLDASRLVGNVASGDLGFGGAVFADKGTVLGVTGSVLAGNTGRFGGAVACFAGSQVNLDRDTICDNTASVFGGGMLVVDAAPFITSTIMAYNEGTAITLAGASTLSINCTNLYGNTKGDWTTQLAAVSDPAHNFNLEPQFCSRDPLDADGLHLIQGALLFNTANGCGVPGAFTRPCGATSTNGQLPQASVVLAATASPNPFNPRTLISFKLGRSQPVRVEVLGLRGELVSVVTDGVLAAGEHVMAWEGRDAQGRPAASGAYFVVVRGQQESAVLKVTLLK